MKFKLEKDFREFDAQDRVTNYVTEGWVIYNFWIETEDGVQVLQGEYSVTASKDASGEREEGDEYEVNYSNSVALLESATVNNLSKMIHEEDNAITLEDRVVIRVHSVTDELYNTIMEASQGLALEIERLERIQSLVEIRGNALLVNYFVNNTDGISDVVRL